MEPNKIFFSYIFRTGSSRRFRKGRKLFGALFNLGWLQHHCVTWTKPNCLSSTNESSCCIIISRVHLFWILITYYQDYSERSCCVLTIWRSVPTSPCLLVFNWFDTHCKKNFWDKIGKWKDKQKSFLCGVRISDWPIWQFPLVPRLFKRLWWNSTFTTNMIVVQTKDKSSLPDELCLNWTFLENHLNFAVFNHLLLWTEWSNFPAGKALVPSQNVIILLGIEK